MSEEKAKTDKAAKKEPEKAKEPEVIHQDGVIVFGAGLNAEHWMAEAKAEGYKVTPVGNCSEAGYVYATLHRESKESKK